MTTPTPTPPSGPAEREMMTVQELRDKLAKCSGGAFVFVLPDDKPSLFINASGDVTHAGMFLLMPSNPLMTEMCRRARALSAAEQSREQLSAEVRRLREAASQHARDFIEVLKEKMGVENENERLRAALEFYADADEDRGKIARAALSASTASAGTVETVPDVKGLPEEQTAQYERRIRDLQTELERFRQGPRFHEVDDLYEESSPAPTPETQSVHPSPSGPAEREKPELLPCPFCGGEALVALDIAERPFITCQNWRCATIPHGRVGGSLEDVVLEWNTRASAPALSTAEQSREQLEAEVRRLREALQSIADKWTPAREEKIQEWEGSGTEAFSDTDFMEASSIMPLCKLARAALAASPPPESPASEGTRETGEEAVHVRCRNDHGHEAWQVVCDGRIATTTHKDYAELIAAALRPAPAVETVPDVKGLTDDMFVSARDHLTEIGKILGVNFGKFDDGYTMAEQVIAAARLVAGETGDVTEGKR